MGALFCPLVARKGLHSGGGYVCVGSGGDSLDIALGGGNVICGWEELQLLVQGLKVGQCLSPNFPPVPPNSGFSAPFTSLEFGPCLPLADGGQPLGLQVGEGSIHLRPAVCFFMGTRNGPKVPDLHRWVFVHPFGQKEQRLSRWRLYMRARVLAHPQESSVGGSASPRGLQWSTRLLDIGFSHAPSLRYPLPSAWWVLPRSPLLQPLPSRTLGSSSPFIALLCFLSFHPRPAHSCNSFIDWSLFRPGHLPGSLGSMPTRTPPRSTSSPPASLHSGMKLLWWHPSPDGVCPSGP